MLRLPNFSYFIIHLVNISDISLYTQYQKYLSTVFVNKVVDKPDIYDSYLFAISLFTNRSFYNQLNISLYFNDL